MSTPRLPELKPCPFCGGEASVYPRTCERTTPYNQADRAFPIVRCLRCWGEAVGKDWGEPATAVAAWNHRVPPDPSATPQDQGGER